MSIEYSPVLGSFLHKSRITLKEYLEVGGLHQERIRSQNQIQVVLNILYLVRWPVYCFSVAGGLSTVKSLWYSGSFNATMISLAVALLPLFRFVLFQHLEEKVDELSKPLPNLHVQEEFERLVKIFSRYSYVGENVVKQALTGDLSFIAAQTLRDMANTLENVENDGSPELVLMARNELRDFHSAAFQLGLCKPNWDSYFAPKKKQKK